jgi:hypothetical protein
MTGQVRSWSIACPLLAGTNLVGNPHPVSQTFTQRAMTTANGFTGSTEATTSDRINHWLGDTSPTTGYDGYYLLKSGPTERWLKVGDATLADQSGVSVFGAGLADFVNSVSGKADWMLPPTWTP